MEHPKPKRKRKPPAIAAAAKKLAHELIEQYDSEISPAAGATDATYRILGKRLTENPELGLKYPEALTAYADELPEARKYRTHTQNWFGQKHVAQKYLNRPTNGNTDDNTEGVTLRAREIIAGELSLDDIWPHRRAIVEARILQIQGEQS